MTPNDVSQSEPQPRRWRTRRRRLLVCVLIALGVFAGVLRYVTSSLFLAPRIEPLLAAISGGEASVGRARYQGGGVLLLEDVRIRIPDVDGPAGRLFESQHAQILIDARALLDGDVNILQVTLDDATLRLSQDKTTGRFNVGGLTPTSDDDGEDTWTIPQIEIRRGVLEMGEHHDGEFERAGRMHIAGRMSPEIQMPGLAPMQEDWYRIDLTEVASPNQPAPPVPLQVQGRLNGGTLEASAFIRGLTFASDRGDILPREARVWWDTIQPSGRFETIAMNVQPNGDFRIEVPMDGIDWSLPVPNFNPDSGQPQPRMTDVRGTVILQRDGVELVGIYGVIDDVTYRVRGRFESVRPTTGLDLTFEVDGFELKRDLTVLTALPPGIRRAIDKQIIKLGGAKGTLDAQVHLQRNPATTYVDATTNTTKHVAGQIRVDGVVKVMNAEGTHDQFPYPLDRIQGEISFTENIVTIESLAATGPGGGKIHVSGEVGPVQGEPRVHMEIFAVDIPVDDSLRAALGPRNGKAVDLFFHKPSAEAMHEAGLYITPTEHDAYEQSLFRELRRLKAEDEARDADVAPIDPETDPEVIRLRELLALPVFELGGRVNLSIDLLREAGDAQPTKVTTVIRLARRDEPIGLVYRKFPYPIRLADGVLAVGYEQVEILRDLILVGPQGGGALITGTAFRQRIPERRVVPDLELTVSDLPMSDLLLHSIPGDAKDENGNQVPWPGAHLSEAAEIVAGLRLDGDFVAYGPIFRGENGHTDFAIRVQTDDAQTGRATPASLPASAWSWPEQFPLTQVNGIGVLSRHGLRLEQFEGTHGDESLSLTGGVDWSASPTTYDLDIAGRNLDSQPRLITLIRGLADEEKVQRLRRFWKRFQPEGRFDMDLKYAQDRETEETTYAIDLRPRDITLHANDRGFRFVDANGTVQLNDGIMQFDHVDANLIVDGSPSGHLTLDGQWDTEAEATDLRGRLAGGKLESELSRYLVQRLGRENDLAAYDVLDPVGLFDADFEYAFDPNGGRVFEGVFSPTSMSGTWRGERFDFSNFIGSVQLAHDGLRFEDLRGTYQDGTFRLSGAVLREDAMSADLMLNMTADNLGPRPRALLPDSATRVIDALELEIQAPIEIRDARILYAEHADAVIEDPTVRPWSHVSFDGDLVLEQATLDVSIPITDFSGTIDLSVERSDDDPWLTCLADLDIKSMRASKRLVRNTQMQIVDGDEIGQLLIPFVRGECYDGIVSGSGKLRVENDDRPGEYAFALMLTDVSMDQFITEPKIFELGTTTPTKADLERVGIDLPLPQVLERINGTFASGLAYGNVSMSGNLDQTHTRIGRGEIRVINAQMYHVPLAMFALQLSTLSLPMSSSLSFADLAFYVAGDEVTFEHIDLESDAFGLHGQGTLAYESKRLDLRFRPRGKRRVPILADAVDFARDQIFSIHVTGTLEEPKREVRFID